MTDAPPDALDPFRRLRSPWRLAVLWALPMGLWLAITCATGVGMFAQALSWKSDRDDWVYTIEGNRKAGDVLRRLGGRMKLDCASGPWPRCMLKLPRG